MKKVFVFFIVMLSCSAILAKSTTLPSVQVSADSVISQGIKQIYNIQFSDAEKTFKSLIADYPQKPQGRFFLAMIDWWKILVDPDNESYDDIFYQKLEDVIYQCDDILKKKPDDAEALFFKGGAIGFRGRLRAYRDSWLKAADDGRQALPIVERVTKIDPKNIDLQLGFGIYDYYVEVIPDIFPIIKPLMIFFPKGDKRKGINELTNVALHGKYAKYEASYFLMSLYYNYENDPFKASEWSKILCNEFPNNPVFERWSGRIAAKKGDFFTASNIFRDALIKADNGYYGYNTLSSKREAVYYIGYQYKIQNKLDSAKIYFDSCAKYSEQIDKQEASGFLVNSYLYIGMINDSWGNRAEAIRFYKKILDVKEFGNSHSLAEEYLKTPYRQ